MDEITSDINSLRRSHPSADVRPPSEVEQLINKVTEALLVTISGWIKHTNRSIPMLLEGAENAFLPKTTGDKEIESAEDHLLTQMHKGVKTLTKDREGWVRHIVLGAKVGSFYKIYQGGGKGLDSIRWSVRFSGLLNPSELVQLGMRNADFILKTIKSCLSSFRALQELVHVTPLDGAYKAYLVPLLDMLSVISSWTHASVAQERLNTCDEMLPSRAVAYLKGLLDLSQDEEATLLARAEVQGAEAQGGDIEEGGVGSSAEIVDDLCAAKRAAFEAALGKEALQIIRAVSEADAKGERRINDEAVLVLFRGAVERNKASQHKNLIASGASLGSMGMAVAFPQIAFLLLTVSIGLNTEMMIEKLFSPRKHNIRTVEEAQPGELDRSYQQLWDEEPEESVVVKEPVLDLERGELEEI